DQRVEAGGEHRAEPPGGPAGGRGTRRPRARAGGDPGQVDGGAPALVQRPGDRPAGGGEVERDTERAGEVVAGAGGDDAEADAGAGDRLKSYMDGAVAAGDDQSIDPVCDRPPARRRR